MIDIKVLFENISNHIAYCKSAPFVCTKQAAFESWFRVEIMPVLWDLQYPSDSIITEYTYPNSRDKADLCVKDQQGDIVFELKSFVSMQDSNKTKSYPKQIEKLEKLIANPSVLQGITFTTFIGYSETRMNNYMNRFFNNNSWDILGPNKLIKKYQLYAAITSIIE